MNVLVIDDQTSVLNGIRQGVHFSELGFDEVFFADSAEKARAILAENPISIMLCDIEMPGENGLSLNRFVSKTYPGIIRILLTSHAEFSYAQESVKLGCFDYILQPAPYEEIEEVLRRAIDRCHLEEERHAVYEKGKLFEELKPEMSDRIVLNLYSRNTETAEESRKMLNRMGYSLERESGIRILMLDLYSFTGSAAIAYGDLRVRKDFITAVTEALRKEEREYEENLSLSDRSVENDFPLSSDRIIRNGNSDIFGNPGASGVLLQPLLTVDRERRFVVLLSGEKKRLSFLAVSWFQSLYDSLLERLGVAPALYVSDPDILANLPIQIQAVNQMLKNNVALKPGVFFPSGSNEKGNFSPDLMENLHRWQRLLEKHDFNQLKESINGYLDFVVSIHLANFNTTCDLHQQLTQMFFRYIYDNNIDPAELFTNTYSYSDFMDAYQNVDTLRKAVNQITDALSERIGEASSEDDIQNAKAFILHNVSQDITVKDVADHVHRSPEYFTRIFKKETGQNIKAYITQVKLDVAKDMLANPNIPVSLVSSEIGYTNFSHFTQIFRKNTGMTPTEYRKRILEQKEHPAAEQAAAVLPRQLSE